MPAEPDPARAEHAADQRPPLRASGLLLFTPALAALVLLLSLHGHPPFALFSGGVLLAVAAAGALHALGLFSDRTLVATRVPAERLAAPFAATLLTALGAWLALRAAVAGRWPAPIASAALSVTLSALLLLFSATWLAASFMRATSARDVVRKPGFLLLALAIVVYVPRLGSFSLIDPWEPHYGEVAREILARDDWLSFWWAQEGWFWSKPALDFWLQALSFLALGVNFMPDRMLAPAGADAPPPWPEWAVRAPGLLLSLIAIYLAYKAVARVAGVRAGFIGGLLLLVAPYWFLIAHQSMTDMPYVAPLSAALALVILGLNTDPEARLRSYAITLGPRAVRVSAAVPLLGLVFVTALPQIAYLLSRNVTLAFDGGPLLSVHGDRFFSGSGAGNCGLPGNDPCQWHAPANDVFQPGVAALVWCFALFVFCWANRGERRTQRWCFLAAWYAVALSVLAKGIPGLVLALAISIAGVCASKRFRELARLELVGCALLIAAIALPWYVQCFMRHGSAFTDRLLFYDMYKRAFVHVHDTNTGDDVSFRYYIWQLGYGLFPWSGLALAAFIRSFRQRDEAHDASAALRAFLGLWFLVAFAMFTVSLTKFHHYILPAVPPLALLGGLFLDELLPRSTGERAATTSGALLCLFAAAAIVLIGRDLVIDGAVDGQARLVHLFSYNYARPFPKTLDYGPAFAAFTGVAALALALAFVPWLRAHAIHGFLAISVAFSAYVLDVYLVHIAPHWGQRETILTYYVTRAGPEEPLVAYQMNWKGENFYTGNRLPAFVSSGAKFKEYVRMARERGTRVMYFTTEHARALSLKSELGDVKSFQILTTPELNNKFFLARVEL